MVWLIISFGCIAAVAGLLFYKAYKHNHQYDGEIE